MDDTPPVSFFKRLGKLVGNVDNLPDGQQLAAGGDLQRLPLDILHDDERAAVSVADLVDLADVRMVERRGGQRLAAQALPRDEVLFVIRMEPLIATRRSSLVSWARKTSPMPPAPSGESMRYRPASRSGIFERVMDDETNDGTINRRSSNLGICGNLLARANQFVTTVSGCPDTTPDLFVVLIRKRLPSAVTSLSNARR